MKTNIKTRLIVIVVVLVAFIYGVFGVPHGVSGTALSQGLLNAAPFRQGIHLGLDLKGGMHLILQVKVEEAVGAETDTEVAGIQSDLQQNGIAGATVSKPDASRPDFIQISGVPAARTDDVRSILDSRYSNRFDIAPGVGNTWTLTMKPSVESEAKQRALDQAIEVITSRTNTLGVSEPIIEPYQLGSYQILVELPGVSDLGRVMQIIQSTARLEAHEVLGGPWPDQQTAMQTIGGYLPPDDELVQSVPGASSEGSTGAWYELRKIPIWAGTDVRDAQPSRDQNTGEPEVEFYLTSAAGDKFAQWTGANVGKDMAIVLDNRVQEVAVIKSQIRDTGTISGGGISEQRTKDLAMLLRTGALPASIDFMQETTVGPRLHPPGSGRFDRRHGHGDGLHADLLPRRGHQCRSGALPEPGHPARIPGLLRRDIDAAGNRRRDSDHRYGRRLQRADLRAHSRRGARGQVAGGVGGSGIRACLDDDCRYARDHHRVGSHPVYLRYGAREGLCRNAHLRSAGEFVHSGLCLPRHF